MKTFLPLLLLLGVATSSSAQITTPVIRANFGVDGDLRANFVNTLVQTGNDDWFRLPGSTGTGQFVIDTTGAAAITAGYTSNPATRRLPFYRTMRYPGYTVVNNRLLLDAVFIRDYHGDDSTVFASGANKNGDSPADWNCPVSQGIPDKNDILDMMVHVRRAGPNRTDSLWMFGGLALDNTTGNRYLDFEMYQTDIYYDRGTRKFYGYGPDAGHTRWQFDAAGNITVPGDIIFSAEYQSSSLTNVEARIWVDRASLSISPSSFDWTGQFDGAVNGSQYGYASIKPKSVGTYYTGLQCSNGTWGGPFGIVLQNDVVATDYTAKQYVEFSVNLTKLGLDPVTLLGSNSCGMPFRRILVKTRSSASFTAELKDFVGPFDFFLAARVQAVTNTPYICQTSNIAQIDVTNPVATSTYVWTTSNGNIVSGNPGTTIFVDKPGSYIVTQYLQDGCPVYAKDTVVVAAMPICQVLGPNRIDNFSGQQNGSQLSLSWSVLDVQQARLFEIQQLSNGYSFVTIAKLNKEEMTQQAGSYSYRSVINSNSGEGQYRIKLTNADGRVNFSSTLRFSKSGIVERLRLSPNPAKDYLTVQVVAAESGRMTLAIYDAAGHLVFNSVAYVQAGTNVVNVDNLRSYAKGLHLVVVKVGQHVLQQKLVVVQ